MTQLCLHLSVHSRHLFLLCLHHPVILSGSFPSSISRTSTQSLCGQALPYLTTTFFRSYLSPSSRHPSPRLLLSAAACRPLNSLAPQPHQSDIFVAPLTPWSGAVAIVYGFHCTPISSVYVSCFLVGVFPCVSPSPYDAFVSIELSYCIIAIRLPTRNTVPLAT